MTSKLYKFGIFGEKGDFMQSQARYMETDLEAMSHAFAMAQCEPYMDFKPVSVFRCGDNHESRIGAVFAFTASDHVQVRVHRTPVYLATCGERN